MIEYKLVIKIVFVSDLLSPFVNLRYSDSVSLASSPCDHESWKGGISWEVITLRWEVMWLMADVFKFARDFFRHFVFYAL